MYKPVKAVYRVFLVELMELPKFRDAVVDFYDDLGFLMIAGFEAPTPDSMSDNTVRLTCAKTVGLVAVIDWEGMAIECDSLGLFAKVNKQFRYICGGDRKMFRRAMQFMIGIAGFEMLMIVAACEIINEAQSHDWKWKVRWTELCDDVMIDADRNIIMFRLPIGVNFLQMEIAKVAGRVQVAVTSRGATRTFTILRSVIELMAVCDADWPFIL
jgi:hypothetical protein